MKKKIFRTLAVIFSVITALIIAEIVIAKINRGLAEKRYSDFAASRKTPEGEGFTPPSPTGKLEARWDPYVGFRYKPDQKALNKTVNEYGFHNKSWPLKKSGKYRIVLMGGSVAEGGADSETISRYLEDELKKTGAPAEVLNCAMTGMMSTQERILFFNEIIEFEPDMVLFLDGINELLPLQYGLNPGEYFYWIVGRYGMTGGMPLSEVIKNFFSKIKLKLIEKSAIARLFAGDIYTGEVPKESIEKAVEIYKKNTDIIRNYAEREGIKTVFFIQPIITTKQTLSVREKYIKQNLQPSALTLYETGYALFSKLAEKEKIVSLTDAFDGISRRLYLDYCHLSPEGNEIIARGMALEIKDELPKIN